jgi:hypothetical protein
VELIDTFVFRDLRLEFIGIATDETRFHMCGSFLEDIPNRLVLRRFGHCKSTIIILSSSFEISCKFCFDKCDSLLLTTFEPVSDLQCIDESAYSWKDLASTTVLPSVEI